MSFLLSCVAPSSRAVPKAAGAFALGVALVAATEANADAPDDLWSDSLTIAGDCGGAFNGPLSEGARCLAHSGLDLLLKAGVSFADEYGKGVLGEHFQFIGDMSYRGGARLEADLDAVIPLATSAAGEPAASSIFFQQGVTRSWDARFGYRNDTRHGVVHRFRIADGPNSDIVGVAAFYQHNAEHGHQVLVSAVDYAGRWGTGSLKHFHPTTGWRSTGSGYSERALEGAELSLTLDMTTTISVDVTGYRWQKEDGSDAWNTGTRLGFDWRPHPWLALNPSYDAGGGGENSYLLQGRLTIPLGGPSRLLPRWQGLGVGLGGSAKDADDLFRPVTDIGAIQVARLATPDDTTGDVTVRFLQDEAATGSTIRLQVSLPAAASEDVRVEVRLVPGSGPNPAQAGVDFVDEPVAAGAILACR